MTTEKLEKLSKTDDSKKVTASVIAEVENSQNSILKICKSLSKSSREYKPEKTIALIHEHIEEDVKTERVLYSVVSNYIFSLEDDDRGIFATNIARLLSFAYGENTCQGECRKIIVKIYDHSQLAVHQIENATKIATKGLDGAKEKMQEDLTKEIKGMEKEYITILGIFAAIILAFVGGITFSSSVLQHMASVNILRLLLVIDLLAVILINAIYVLMRFIFVINGHDTGKLKIWLINLILLIIGVAVAGIGFWNLGICW